MLFWRSIAASVPAESPHRTGRHKQLWPGRRRGVVTAIGHAPGIDISPGRGVGPIDQELATEVQNMPSVDQRDHVGWIEDHLLIDRVGGGAEAVKVVDVHIGEVVRFGKLQSQFGGKALIERWRNKEVQLVGKAHARFVDEVWTEGPHIGDRGVVAAYIVAVAVNRANPNAVGVPRVVAFRLGEGKPVGRGNVIVQAAKPLDKRVRAGRAGGEIVQLPLRGHLPGGIGRQGNISERLWQPG